MVLTGVEADPGRIPALSSEYDRAWAACAAVAGSATLRPDGARLGTPAVGWPS